MVIIAWIGIGILIGNALFFGILMIIYAAESRKERKEREWP